MIAFLNGTIVSADDHRLVLNVGGMGFQMNISTRDAARIPPRGEELLIYTYLSVREDAMTLFGFLSEDDLEVYKLMLNVSGIGPKAAMGILSVLSADDLRFAVLSDDAKTIAKAPGIGNKTAQKLILELKDKLDLEEAFEKKLEKQSGETAVEDASAQAVQALAALGYSNSEALRAVKKVDIAADMSIETILKLALKHML